MIGQQKKPFKKLNGFLYDSKNVFNTFFQKARLTVEFFPEYSYSF